MIAGYGTTPGAVAGYTPALVATGGDFAIDAALTPAGNFIVQTTSAGSGSGDINVNSTINFSTASTLTLDAYNNINVNAAITSTNASGKVALIYGQNAIASGNAANYNIAAPINLQAGQNFTTQLGSNGATTSYTVITAPGSALDSSPTSATATTLQGLDGGSAVLAGNFAIGANIDASAITNFSPIGATYDTANAPSYATSAGAFTGTFAGLGHTISTLTINTAQAGYVGLFAYAYGATIRDIGLTGGSVTDTAQSQYIGALVGKIAGGTSSSATGGTLIFNDYALGTTVSTTSPSGSDYVGGLIGGAQDSTIKNSYATGDVTAAGSASINTGGLVGLGNGVDISGSIATGSVSGGENVGGLAGRLSGNNQSAEWSVTTSYATGAVTSSSGVAGGFAGLVCCDVAVSNSYATGNVLGTGGDVFGGFAGNLGNGASVSTSYASGAVTKPNGATFVGGFAGDIDNTQTLKPGASAGSLSNVDWNATVNPGLNGSGGSSSTGSSGLSTVTLQDGALPSNFSSSIWTGGVFGTNSGYPTIAGDLVLAASNIAVTIDLAAQSATYGALFTLSQSAYAEYEGMTQLTGGGLITLAGLTLTAVGTGTASGTLATTGAMTYTINGSTPTNPGYTFTVDAGAPTVGKASLTITAAGQSATYGTPATLSTALTTGYTETGLINSDAIASLTVTPTGTGSATGTSATTNAGAYALTASAATGSGLANYNIAYDAGALTVGKLPIVLVGSRLYDGASAIQSSNLTLINGVNGDTAGSIALTGAGSVASVNVGAGSQTLTLTGLSVGNGNYTITGGSGTASFTARPITIAANNQTRVEGESNPPFGYVVGGLGLVGGDGLIGSLTTAATMGSPEGAYPIDQGTLAASSNYAVTYLPGTLLIADASATADDFASTYVVSSVPTSIANLPSLSTSPQFVGGSLSIPQFVGSLGDPRFDSIVVDGVVITNDDHHTTH